MKTQGTKKHDHNAGQAQVWKAVSPLWGAESQDGAHNGHIEQHYREKAAQSHYPDVHKDDHLIGWGVCIGQLEDEWCIAEIVGLVGPSVGQMECQGDLDIRVKGTTDSGASVQEGTRSPTYHDAIPDWITDSQIVIIW
jgi:hypothetical protein